MPVRFSRHKGVGRCLLFSSFKSQQSDITCPGFLQNGTQEQRIWVFYPYPLSDLRFDPYLNAFLELHFQISFLLQDKIFVVGPNYLLLLKVDL